MELRLHTVPARQGLRWIQQGMALWIRHPLAFVGLFSLFMLALMVSALIPWVGSLLAFALMPLLSLGYMIAARAATVGERVGPGALLQALMAPEVSRRKTQWLLCGAYALAVLGVLLLGDWLDDGRLAALVNEVAQKGRLGDAAMTEKVLADPVIVRGLYARMALLALLAVPFWHAPALVHWAGQGALQAVFTSVLALWRARGAFVLYLAGWYALSSLGMSLAVLLASAVGANALAGIVMLSVSLALVAGFYVSLWFCFRDSFMGSDAAASTGGGPSA